MSYIVPHFLEGQRFSDTKQDGQDIYNPALGKVIGHVHFASKDTCEKAVSSAKRAFPSWAKTPPIKRAQILFKFRTLLEKHKLDLAKLVTLEQGKTLEDAKGSVSRAIEVVELHCGLVNELMGSTSIEVATNIDCTTIKQSLGVCVGISPFNFPVMVPVWMVIPAIACGNTFILKPSEQDPSPAIFLLELLSDAGLPDGVVSCLQGDKDTVNFLITHPDVQAVTAVASTPVAEHIYKTSTSNGKRSSTFGGAKNHCIVLPDAPFEQAADAIVGAAYGSAGERCMAISVVVVIGEETAATLLAHMLPKIKAINVGAGDAVGSDMGPVISAAHKKRVLEFIEAGVDEGANLLIDGRSFKHPQYPDGFYIAPCLFDNVTESMSIYQNEIFGPVLVIVRVGSFTEALDLVNRNQHGNGTAIFTRDGYMAREYSQRVEVGMVGINIPIPVPVANHPFGGWKRSVFGDTNMHGLESIHFYTRRKSITSKWLMANSTNSPFVMPTHQE